MSKKNACFDPRTNEMSVTGINSNLKSTDNVKGYLNGNGKKSNFTTCVSLLTEDGKNKEDLIQWVKEAKIMYNNKNQQLCSNNRSLEIKKKLIKSSICSVALYG